MARYRTPKYTPEEAAERRKISDAKYYQKNKDKLQSVNKENKAEWYKNNSDKVKEYNKAYRSENKIKERKQQADRYASDDLYKLSCNVRCLINDSTRRKKFTKQSKTADILGCTWEQFKQHIESQFEPWMTWDNRGGKVVVGPNMTWDLDHIIPISSAVTEDDVKRLNHYTNFQPLCSYQNRFVKRNKT
jgi:hypothetical protein